MPVTLKKVVLQTSSGEFLPGFLDPQRLDGLSEVELLSPEGQLRALPADHVDVVYQVQDFDVPVPPRRSSSLAPRGPGLWLRLRLRGRESIEAVAPNEMLLWSTPGVELDPLSASGGCSRIWIARRALESVQVLAVLSSPVRRSTPAASRRRPARSLTRDQIPLFGLPADGDSER